MKKMIEGMLLGMMIAGAGSYMLFCKLSEEDVDTMKKDVKKMVKDGKKSLDNMMD